MHAGIEAVCQGRTNREALASFTIGRGRRSAIIGELLQIVADGAHAQLVEIPAESIIDDQFVAGSIICIRVVGVKDHTGDTAKLEALRVGVMICDGGLNRPVIGADIDEFRYIVTAGGHSNVETRDKQIPLIYQGASDDFRGPLADVEFPDEAMLIDIEGEFGVVLSDVPMGTTAEIAAHHVRLIVQINDWSLRAFGPREMRAGFGFVQAKPSTAFAPVAVTPDELGSHWANGRVGLPLHVSINDREVGHADGSEMHFSFGELIAYCARTRRLSAGTMIGSGTVSNADRAAGSSCISEIRTIELLDEGAARTPFLTWGDRVRMEARLPDGSVPFGVIDQRVVQV